MMKGTMDTDISPPVRWEYPDTPLFRQYQGLREKAGEALLFFRLGDFYELFGDQAVEVSRVLGLTLTSRDRNKSNPLPMCGVPARSLELYLPRLVSLGYRIAISEQTQPDSESDGMFSREIVRIVTRSTLIEDPSLEGGQTKNGVCLAQADGAIAISSLDLSSGHLAVFEPQNKGDIDAILDWMASKSPVEILIADPELSLLLSGIEHQRILPSEMPLNGLADVLPDAFVFPLLSPASERALVTLIAYVGSLKAGVIHHLTGVTVEKTAGTLVIDRASIRHLDLVPDQEDRKKNGSLLEVLDQSRSALGSRMLRRWLLAPLSDRESILMRQWIVRRLDENPRWADRVGEILGSTGDIERILGRIGMKGRLPRDLGGIRDGIQVAIELARMPEWTELLHDEKRDSSLETLSEMVSRLAGALVDDPPVSCGESPVIRDGFDPELDGYRHFEREADQDLLRIEERERKATGIETLRIRYNQVAGYYIEVTKGQVSKVPPHYFRKQTLTGVERYTLPELLAFEQKMTESRFKAQQREFALLDDLTSLILSCSAQIQRMAEFLGTVDALLSFARVGRKRQYVLPTFSSDGAMSITNGRHPIVEARLAAGAFMPNDTRLEAGTFVLLTGPNMAGKSTYMRQLALIQIMAQMGAPVPADNAVLPIVDRILTRVGANDHILEGDSTFMVEMKEVARVLRDATAKSLVILDEVGRGTATFDGMAIAWAVSEYIHDRVRSLTLFATHYHELHALAERGERFLNQSVAVRIEGGKIFFPHRISSGHSSKSYGIDVAKLAGVPEIVIDRATRILDHWNRQKPFKAISEGLAQLPEKDPQAMPIFDWKLRGGSSSQP
jgi:DNA mismatch repair protein MutS